MTPAHLLMQHSLCAGDINHQAPGEAYLPSRGNCQARLICLFLFRGLDLDRNAAKVSESLKISDPHMAKLFRVVFFEVATA